jgi:hypothetical protein
MTIPDVAVVPVAVDPPRPRVRRAAETRAKYVTGAES